MPSSLRSGSKAKAGPVLEAVLQMMEQGPQPMRNMKPTQKIPNSADHFEADHQAGYESYEDHRANDRCSQVNAHNAASPKMKDELDRRRSVSKPTATSVVLASKSNVYYDPRCRACQKLMQAEAKKRNVKPKKNIEKKRKTDKKTRVTKKKGQRKAKSNFRLAKLKTNKGCQYSVFTNKGTLADLADADPTKTDGDSELIYFSGRRRPKNSQSSQAALTNPSANASKSDVISQNPDTSVNSLSSYNSNMSLDHEPMLPS